MVGLVLANARGTSLARRLWTRWRVGLLTAALSFTWLALMLWSMPSSAARKADGGTRDAIRLACFH